MYTAHTLVYQSYTTTMSYRQETESWDQWNCVNARRTSVQGDKSLRMGSLLGKSTTLVISRNALMTRLHQCSAGNQYWLPGLNLATKCFVSCDRPLFWALTISDRISKRLTGYTKWTLFELLNPTGYMLHQQFNIQQLYVLPTLYLCVLYLSENKQRLVPLTA